MFKEEAWQALGYPIYIAQLPLSYTEIEQRLGVSFSEVHGAGLLAEKNLFMQIEPHIYWLRCRPNLSEIEAYPALYLRADNPNPLLALSQFLDACQINAQDLIKKNPNLSESHWVLERLDDNNNTIEMCRFMEQRSAEFVKQMYQDKGHKQTYLVRFQEK